MNSVNERNASALAQAIKDDRVKLDTLRERVQHLEAQVAMQVEAVTMLQQRLAVMLASRGTGPTSR